ncbi:hypothetical protein CIW52_17920 [Mycolicibacterium sp. P9-64]|uniref:hypothetical protein n=1 Tax=Mycolicibacterium sp. P9-64 TaxID=2024612 RepID=UPI0011EEB4B4|nr:hypothetical protein [Mycolicibacterium sp. P9-64]KAA0081637.1 hypothetical protein CIW52_17920 [Mycolicibacterium sp. P9-64]
MCGACGAGPDEPLAALVAGPRRRAAIAAAATRLGPRLRVRVAARAWTVAERTGRVTVCRTFDELLDVLARSGVPRTVAESDLLSAAAAASAQPAALQSVSQRDPVPGRS